MSTPYEQAVEAAVAALSGPRMVVNDTGSQRKRDVEEAITAALPHLLAPIEALHEPVEVWEYDDTNGTFVQDADGERVLLARLCRGCSDSDVLGAIEDCEYHADWFAGEVLWPCATAAALASIKGQPS